MPVSAHIAQARLDYFAREESSRVDTPSDMSQATAKTGRFFSGDVPSFRDVLDALNPLNHIPIVSDIFASISDHTPSIASKLAGGAIIGGPIGFVMSLGEAIFQSAIGATPSQVALAALEGDSPIEVAALGQLPEDLSVAAALAPTWQQPASPIITAALGSNDSTVLDLYGDSRSANDSYKKAQLLPYLREVNISKVI